MSRDDGFAVMDVSVDIINDPKIRKLYREAPECAGAGFIAYVATMGESWKAGHRVTVRDSWPAFVPFDAAVVAALMRVKLIDRSGFVSSKAWKSWFTPAQSRREAVRERWRRANEKRANPSTNDRAVTGEATALQPRGDSAATAANHSVPFRSDSVPLDTRDSPPPPTSGGRRKNGTNPRANGSAPRHKRANPRANGTSVRQERITQKRGPSKLAEVLRESVARTEADQADDGPEWLLRLPEHVEAEP